MYLENFKSVDDVFEQFDVSNVDRTNVEILVAVYELYSYEGSAWVLFRKEGKLYEVNASHCSCFALENQWDPEETDYEALSHRKEKGTYFARYSKEVAQEIEKLK
jgi:hypothetical protein